jgi:MFS family permease
MIGYRAWLHGAVNDLCKPLNKDEYRVLGIVAVLGPLVGAVIGFIAVPRWDAALIVAILSIPGGLLAGALSIALRRYGAARQSETAKRPTTLRGATLALVLLAAITVVLNYTTPSRLIRTIEFVTVAGAVFTIIRPDGAKRPALLLASAGLATAVALLVVYTIRSQWIQITVIAVAVAVQVAVAIVRHVSRRKKVETDSAEPGRR